MKNSSAYYVLEKLGQAIDTLATGSERIQERLQEAGAINLGPARPEDIPYEDLRRILAGVKDDLSFQPASGNQGTIAATMKITSDEDARAIARRILRLYDELKDRLGREG
jgi:hypothetical protein